MSILLDTCVISESRRSKCAPQVLAFLDEIPFRELYLSAISIGEVAKGIALLEPEAHQADLGAWLQRLRLLYGKRILPVDDTVAQTWGELTAAARQQGLTLPASDGLIAATAIQHDLTVATRNVKDFEVTGVRVVNPWDYTVR